MINADYKSSDQSYRPDIDGLRALAVLLVISFYAFPLVIPGGFVGVDVFFVISGYLISSIILKGLATGSFSFIDFYARRTRRIFPALILVLLSSLLVGSMVLLSDEYSRLLRHSAGGATFLLNYFLMSEAGYFDRLGELKPLLHLWSLGVEEQFYAIWPFLLWLAWKLRQKIWLLIAVLGLLSFFWSLVELRHNPTSAFYSLQTRFWELLVGAGLAYANLFAPHRLPTRAIAKTWCSIGGLSLILIGVVFIDPTKRFPGWWALLPTAGAVLLIASQSDGLVNKFWLSRRWMVWIGLISFPLYLWHGATFSYARIYLSDQPTLLTRVLVIMASFGLATVTYLFIERPIRSRQDLKLTIGLLAVLSGIAVFSFQSHGLQEKQRQTVQSEFYAYFADSPPRRWLTYFERGFRHDCNFYQVDEYYASRPTDKPKAEIARSCFTADPLKQLRVLIWGDSHAQMLNSGLTKTLPENWQILQIASSGCVARVDNIGPSATDYCRQANWFALDTIERVRPDVVIIAQSHGHDVSQAKRIANRLESLDVTAVLFLGPSPQWQADLPKILVRQLWSTMPERTWVGFKRDLLNLNEKLKRDFVATPHSSYVDVLDLFCNLQGCLTRIGDDPKIGSTSWDYGHLTEIASEYLAKELLVPIMLKRTDKKN
jgi:peptidoglycan/LPS O-acetylase OafA/YrhL